MDKIFIIEGKKHIDFDSTLSLTTLYNTILDHQKNSEYSVNIQNIFQKLFLYSCIKSKKSCIQYLFNLYGTFDTVTKIALRQSFFYGKYLIKDKAIQSWYSKDILPKVKKQEK